MSETKFTPGPWLVEEGTHGDILVRCGDNSTICVVPNGDLCLDGRQAENANLIAAAPVMHEVLEAIAIALDKYKVPPAQILDESGPVMDVIRDVLKAARGEQ
jgi:hypothetical protein